MEVRQGRIRGQAPRGRVGEVFGTFLKLGVTSFGGPIAHLGYFRDEIVIRRQWLRDREYADLVALSQFLPGPASSQVGFGLGLLRAGPLGALAAFTAFTLPSAVLMVALALGASWFQGVVGTGVLAGLKLVAVAVVAQAVWGMSRTLTPDRPRIAIAVLAALTVLFWTGSAGQVLAIVLGAAAGLVLCRPATGEVSGPIQIPVTRRAGALCLLAFTVLLIGLPLAAEALRHGPQPPVGSGSLAGGVSLAAAFYRTGSLVFGGGHVVLPLLQADVVGPGWVGSEQFLAGYGTAQAMPGPLFTFAGYLGVLSTTGPGGALGAAIALAAVFLPGFLLLTGVLPFWNQLRCRPRVQALVRGANAAVVGVLAAALYDPVFTTAVTGPATLGVALLCFVLLMTWKTPPWAVVIIGATAGVVLQLTG